MASNVTLTPREVYTMLPSYQTCSNVHSDCYVQLIEICCRHCARELEVTIP